MTRKMRVIGNDPLSMLKKASEEYLKRTQHAEYHRSQMSEYEYNGYTAKTLRDKENAESLYVPKAIAEFKTHLATFKMTEQRVHEARAGALTYENLSDHLTQAEIQVKNMSPAELRNYAEDTKNLESDRSLAKARYYAVMNRSQDLIANSRDMDSRMIANEIYSIANRNSVRIDITADVVSANKKMDAVFDMVFDYANEMESIARTLNNQDMRKALEHLEITRNVLPSGDIKITLEVVQPEQRVRIVEPVQPIGGEDLSDAEDLRGLEDAPPMGGIQIGKRIKADISGISKVSDMNVTESDK